MWKFDSFSELEDPRSVSLFVSAICERHGLKLCEQVNEREYTEWAERFKAGTAQSVTKTGDIMTTTDVTRMALLRGIFGTERSWENITMYIKCRKVLDIGFLCWLREDLVFDTEDINAYNAYICALHTGKLSLVNCIKNGTYIYEDISEPNEVLKWAFKTNHHDIVDELVNNFNSGTMFNVQTNNGFDNLVQSVAKGDCEVVEQLISGANPKHREILNEKGKTMLQVASANNDLSMCRVLLTGSRDEFREMGGMYYSPLVNAARNENLELVELLLNGGTEDYKTGISRSKYALFVAAENGDEKIVTALLRGTSHDYREADFVAPRGYGPDNHTALSIAAWKHHYKCVHHLIQGARPEYLIMCNAIKAPIKHRNVEIFKLMILHMRPEDCERLLGTRFLGSKVLIQEVVTLRFEEEDIVIEQMTEALLSVARPEIVEQECNDVGVFSGNALEFVCWDGKGGVTSCKLRKMLFKHARPEYLKSEYAIENTFEYLLTFTEEPSNLQIVREFVDNYGWEKIIDVYKRETKVMNNLKKYTLIMFSYNFPPLLYAVDNVDYFNTACSGPETVSKNVLKWLL